MIVLIEGKEFADVKRAVTFFALTITSCYYSKLMRGSFKLKVFNKSGTCLLAESYVLLVTMV